MEVLNVAEMQCNKATKHQLFPIGGAIIDIFSSIIQTIACQQQERVVRHETAMSGVQHRRCAIQRCVSCV